MCACGNSLAAVRPAPFVPLPRSGLGALNYGARRGSRRCTTQFAAHLRLIVERSARDDQIDIPNILYSSLNLFSSMRQFACSVRPTPFVPLPRRGLGELNYGARRVSRRCTTQFAAYLRLIVERSARDDQLDIPNMLYSSLNLFSSMRQSRRREKKFSEIF